MVRYRISSIIKFRSIRFVLKLDKENSTILNTVSYSNSHKKCRNQADNAIKFAIDWKDLRKCMYIYRLPFSNTMHACGTALYCYNNFLNLKFFSVSKLIFMTLTCWHLVGSVSCPCVSWGWLTNESLSDPPSRIRVTEITQSAHVSDRPGFWIISISQLNRYPICLSMLYQCFFMTNRLIWFVWQY